MSSPLSAGRTILSVVGPHSGCGKTTFVTALLREVPGLGCLKISPARDWPAPSPDSDNEVGEDYYLERASRLTEPGKDTTLYLEAGAGEVKRLRHWRDGLVAGLEAALGGYPPGMPVVVESSGAVSLLNPVAVILVVRPPIEEMKPSTEAILSQVTDLLINAADREGSATAEAQRLQHASPALSPQFIWSADLISEPLPRKMLTRLGALLAP